MSPLLYLFYAILVYIAFKVIKFVYAFYKLSKHIPYKEPDLQKRFSKQSLPKNIDYVIIGSGMGGLMTAALLSKLGKQVVVLEQHTMAGGCLHTFTEKGYTFDTGFHYIGYKQDYLSFMGFALSKPIDWSKIKKYDLIKLNDDKPFPISGPLSQFQKDLKEWFPENSKEIDVYFDKIIRAETFQHIMTFILVFLPKFLHPICANIVLKLYQDLAQKTTIKVLEEIGIAKNKKLAAILCGQFGDLGVPPKQSPFDIHAGLVNHYSEGAIYPKGGPAEIVKSIVSTINYFGGEVLTKARVEKILVDNGKIKGLLLKSGITIECPNVISAIGNQQTVALLDEQYKWKVTHPQGISHFYCFLGLKDNPDVDSANLWHLKCGQDYDLDKMRDNYLNNMDFNSLYSIVSSSSAKENQSSEKKSVIIVTEAKSEWVEKYRVNEVQRKEGYKEFKNKIQEALLNEFVSQFPHLKDKIDYIDTATPLSNDNYLGRYASYGMEITKDRFEDNKVFLKVDTSIEGLFLSGQDVTFPGICGATISGFFSALKVAKVI